MVRMAAQSQRSDDHAPENGARSLNASKRVLAGLLAATSASAAAQQAGPDAAGELAKKLANPVAALISVPLQYNSDGYGGANDSASVHRLNAQPVIPVSISEE
jgi:hypothetical protein